jgi:DNA-binding PucR family transcriptional regulator
LDKLAEHDEKYGTEYYKTFYRLLHSGGDKAAAANNLFIHRNTLNYRLSKIFDLIDVDLQNGEEAIFLHLSYKMKELMRCIEAQKNRQLS